MVNEKCLSENCRQKLGPISLGIGIAAGFAFLIGLWLGMNP